MFMTKGHSLLISVATCLPPCRGLSNSSYLTATSIVTNAQNHSALECWELTSPLKVSDTAGTSGAASYDFANVDGAEYTVIPPRFNGGTHNAPAPQ